MYTAWKEKNGESWEGVVREMNSHGGKDAEKELMGETIMIELIGLQEYLIEENGSGSQLWCVGLVQREYADSTSQYLGNSSKGWMLLNDGRSGHGGRWEQWADLGPQATRGKWSTGDRIKVAYNKVSGTIQFWQHDRDLGIAWTETPGLDLIPGASLCNNNTKLRIVSDDYPPLPDHCSDSLHDFLVLCFKKEPSFRKSASALLNEQWVRSRLKRVRPLQGRSSDMYMPQPVVPGPGGGAHGAPPASQAEVDEFEESLTNTIKATQLKFLPQAAAAQQQQPQQHPAAVVAAAAAAALPQPGARLHRRKARATLRPKCYGGVDVPKP